MISSRRYWLWYLKVFYHKNKLLQVNSMTIYGRNFYMNIWYWKNHYVYILWNRGSILGQNSQHNTSSKLCNHIVVRKILSDCHILSLIFWYQSSIIWNCKNIHNLWCQGSCFTPKDFGRLWQTLAALQKFAKVCQSPMPSTWIGHL